MSSHRSGSGGSLSPVSEVNRRSTLKPTNYDLQKQHYDDADGGDSGRRHLYIDQSNYRMNSFAPQNAWEPMPRGWLQLLWVARSYLLQIAQSCLFKGKIAWVARSKKPCECNLISFKLLEVACICLKLLKFNAFPLPTVIIFNISINSLSNEFNVKTRIYTSQTLIKHPVTNPFKTFYINVTSYT